MNKLLLFAITSMLLVNCNLSDNSKNLKIESSGLFRVIQNDKVGFIDKTGKIVINPQFYKAFNFQEGLAGVDIPM